MNQEIGTEGKLGSQAKVKDAAGSWRDLIDAVNTASSRLTAQVRDIAEEARRLKRAIDGSEDAGHRRPAVAADVARLERKLEDVMAIDHFGAPGQEAAAGLVKELRVGLAAAEEHPRASTSVPAELEELQGRLWVTRAGGLMLVVVGLLLLTGWWDVLVADLRGWSAGYGVAV